MVYVLICACFPTGLEYRIDRNGETCTIGPISASTYTGILTKTDPYKENATWSLRMRNGSELLFIDDTYKFVGQVSLHLSTSHTTKR